MGDTRRGAKKDAIRRVLGERLGKMLQKVENARRFESCYDRDARAVDALDLKMC